MHFSRSPFMALAVTAMIGRLLNCGSLRITRIVSRPSISGIMMSIRTMSIVGLGLEDADGVATRLGGDDDHVAPLQDARQREDVADVVVDDQDLLAREDLVGLVELLDGPALGLGQLVDRRVEEEGGLVEEPLGRARPAGRPGSGRRPGPESSPSLRRPVGVEDHRQGRGPARRRGSRRRNSSGVMSGIEESSTRQSTRLPSRSSSASPPSDRGGDPELVAADRAGGSRRDGRRRARRRPGP